MATAMLEPAWAADEEAVRDLLRDGADEMEAIRLRWLKSFMFAWLAALVLVPVTAGVYALAPDLPAVWGTVAGASLVTLLVMGSTSGKHGERLVAAFVAWRDQVVRALNPDADLDPSGYLESDVFDASGLNGAYYNRYSGWNHLALGPMRASNLAVDHVYTVTVYETVSSTDANGNTTYQQVARQKTVVDPIFHGVLLIVPAPLPHPGTVVVSPSGAGLDGLREVRVMSPDLRNNYAIGASEPFVGHRTLTPSLQAALWDYCCQQGCRAGFAYRDGLLYVTLPGATLEFGSVPGKWQVIGESRLMRVVEICRAALNFMHDSADTLRPELD
jgi:hypothetical protein